MANLSEDIQCAGSDTRPPILDRTDFASWQQRIRLYCRGKDNRVNILKSIDEGPYRLGTFRETLAESTEGTPQFGPERPRVYSDLKSEEKDRQHKEESIHDYYVRFAKLINDMRNIKMTMSKLQLNSKFVNNMLPEWGRFENKMMLERLSQPTAQPTADPLALLSNVSNTQHGSPSSSTSSFTQLPSPRTDSSSPADDLIENLTSTLALLTQSYRTFLPKTNNQLRTSSNARNQATVQDGTVVVQNIQGRPNRGQGMNPWGGSTAGYGEAHNRVGNVTQGQARLGQARTVKCYNCNGTGHIVWNCTQPKRPQNFEYFKDKMLLMQAQENGVALDAVLGIKCTRHSYCQVRVPTGNTRPPMLDRTDFASWQQQIRLYCRDKDNGVNILKSIDEGPYRLGTFRETLAESTEGTPQFEKDWYNADIWATNILLQGLPKDIYTLINHYTDAKDIWDNVKMLLEGSELTKEDRESQLYEDFEHFRQHKEESIHDYYVRMGRFVTAAKLNRGLRDSNYDQLFAYLKQHDAHAKENKMMLERLSQPTAQPTADPLALLSNVSNTQHGSLSSSTSSFTQLPSPRADSRYGEAHNRVGNVNQGQARLSQARTVKCYNCNGTGHIAWNCTQPKRPQNSEYFKDKMLSMQAQENGVALDAVLGIKCTRHSHCQVKVPTGSISSHCQKKRDATARRLHCY
nr:hypothetical protein [Tanacetum cinerariifolium]